MEAHKVDPATGEDEMALALALAPMLAGNGNGAQTARNAERSDELGQGRPQRGVPLRLRQEVQALPRQVRVARTLSNSVGGYDHVFR